MKFLLVIAALVTSSAFASGTSENPHEVFSMEHNNSNNVKIKFIQASNIQKTCDAESRKRGFGGFGYSVEACSFFDTSAFNNSCTIVTGKTTNFHTIGHEVRHCLQGNFHK
jgi:hypothetical protein